jgi:nucleotide-binding universal stress UspA family protein
MKILIPVDFSENSIKAFELALSLNRNQKTIIILVHIVELIYDFASQAAIALDSMHTDAKKLLDEIEKKYKSEHLEFEKIVEEGTASISISRLAIQNEVGMIVIGTSGSGRIKKLIMGSTAQNLLKESSVPVLVVPAKAPVSQIGKLTMALQFSNHEKPLLHQVIAFTNNWGLEISFLQVSTAKDFKDELACLGLATYLRENFQLKTTSITIIESDSTNAEINSYFETTQENILVMCHQHKNFWKEFQESSHSVAMAYQSTVPILIMI